MADLIDLDSKEGEELLSECAQLIGSCYQPFIHGIFCKQMGGSTCGIQSCALIISAAHLGQSRPPVTSPIPAGHPEVAVSKDELKFTEETLLNAPLTQNIVAKEVVNKSGTTLQQVYDVLIAHGYYAEMHLASEVSVDKFRHDAVAALSKADSSCGIVVNYHMNTLGQALFLGHHSPLAAYHKATDRFLILDTWHATKECWPKVENLFNAMNTVDEESGKTRGYILFRLQ